MEKFDAFWKFPSQRLYFYFWELSNQRLIEKGISPQIYNIHNLVVLGLILKSHGKNNHSNVTSKGVAKYIINERVVTPSNFKWWWVLWIQVSLWFVHGSKMQYHPFHLVYALQHVHEFNLRTYLNPILKLSHLILCLILQF